MNELRAWAFSLCALCVATGAITMIIPSGNLHKMVNLTLGAFFLLALISPLKNITGGSLSAFNNYSYDTQDIYEKTAEITQKILEDQAAQSIYKVIDDKLSDIEIKNGNIRIIVNTNEDNSILISKVILTLNEEYHFREDEVRKIIEDNLKLNLIISYK